MLVDNVLNGADPKTYNYFQDLEPRARSITQKDVTVLADHQISQIKLRHINRNGLTSQYGVQPNAIIIYGQLFDVTLQAGHDTNVMTIDGRQADPDDKDRQYDEIGMYVMNRNDLENAIKAGAYDKPQYFEDQLNKELHGIEYQLPTRLHLNILDVTGPKSIDLTDTSQGKASISKRLIMVNDAKPTLRFSYRKPRQYNNFDFFLSQSINDIYKDFQANDDGVGMDDLIIDQQSKADSEASRSTKHLIASLSSTPSISKPSSLASEQSVSGNIADSSNKHNIKPKSISSSEEQALATKEHISNQEHVVNNELDMNPNSKSKSSSSSLKDDEASSEESNSEKPSKATTKDKENRGISRNASTVTNELNMGMPYGVSKKKHNKDQYGSESNKSNSSQLDDTPDDDTPDL